MHTLTPHGVQLKNVYKTRARWAQARCTNQAGVSTTVVGTAGPDSGRLWCRRRAAASRGIIQQMWWIWIQKTSKHQFLITINPHLQVSVLRPHQNNCQNIYRSVSSRTCSIIKTCRSRDSHFKDKPVLRPFEPFSRPSYLYHGNPYTVNIVSLFWNNPQMSINPQPSEIPEVRTVEMTLEWLHVRPMSSPSVPTIKNGIKASCKSLPSSP